MSHVFLQPGHSPQRPDWLAEDAVSCEPVSARNSLLTGKFTGILLESGSPPATSASVSSQFNGFRSNSLYNGTGNFRTRIRENLSRNSEFAILIFTPNFRFARERISARWSTDQVPDQKNCSWALAIRDCRAASCLRIRDGEFRAAAIPAPRGRRN